MRLEPYGAAPGSSPAVAQLAGDGRALDGVYATAPWTVPSHASMFTGLLPRAAGLSRVQSPLDLREPLARHRPRMLSQVMRDNGYFVGGASANLWLSPTTQFDASFDEFVEIDTDRNAQIHLESLRERLRWYAEAVAARADDGAEKVARTLERWADSRQDKPFFWFVNLLECHSPYLPPRPYGGRAPIARLRTAADARRYYTLEGLWRTCAGVEEVPDAALQRGRHFYAASIRYMDDWLAGVLEMLDRRRILEETLVIVLSDHGENFGEDGLIGHGLSVDNRLIHVPIRRGGPRRGGPGAVQPRRSPPVDRRGLWSGGSPLGTRAAGRRGRRPIRSAGRRRRGGEPAGPARDGHRRRPPGAIHRADQLRDRRRAEARRSGRAVSRSSI